ncbi:MAG: hypothetical protein JWM40_1357 [Frankiales bacterium]|nr:hypothetical protein [Frankiales bacterium]
MYEMEGPRVSPVHLPAIARWPCLLETDGFAGFGSPRGSVPLLCLIADLAAGPSRSGSPQCVRWVSCLSLARFALATEGFVVPHDKQHKP